MTIKIGPEQRTMLTTLARELGKTSGELALELLTQRIKAKYSLREPQDDWERQLLALGRDCGVSLSNEALSREEIYD